MAVLDAQFMKLPSWSCAASNYFITPHIAEYPMARIDQDSIRAAGGASSLIRNAGVKEVGRYSTVRDLLCDMHVMLSQSICAAYIHTYEDFKIAKHCQEGQGGGERASEHRSLHEPTNWNEREVVMGTKSLDSRGVSP
eukprot:793656-Pelagomonas_calceolata.AAC.1